MKLATRVRRIQPSPTLAITNKAKQMKAQGIDVVGFGAGEPEFDTPDHIKAVAKKALDDAYTKYTPDPGSPELKDAIIAKLNLARGASGSTTVGATMLAACRAGISVLATGGIGGVHRGSGESGDVSADLTALSRYPVAVVCAGAKAILDLPKTVEMLETLGVPVLGHRTDDFPAFYRRHSGLPVDGRCDDIARLASAVRAHFGLGTGTGVIVANPIPVEHELPQDVYDRALGSALAAAEAAGVRGRDVTPFLLDRMRALTEGASVTVNGCGGTLNCGGCPRGYYCVGGVCDTLSCFVAGTPIILSDGSSKSIEEIAVGETVLSLDPENGMLAEGRVAGILEHPSTPALVRIKEQLTTTPEHRFFIEGAWLRADHLRLGHRLTQPWPHSGAEVHRLESLPGGVTTYNLEVVPFHTYFAGGVLVHNEKNDGP